MSTWPISCGSFSNYLLLIHPNCTATRTMEKGEQNSEISWHLVQINSVPHLHWKHPWNRQKSWSMDASQVPLERNLHAQRAKAALPFPSLEWPLRSGAWQQQRSFTATNFPSWSWTVVPEKKLGKSWGAGTELQICFSFVFLPFSKFSSTPKAG